MRGNPISVGGEQFGFDVLPNNDVVSTTAIRDLFHEPDANLLSLGALKTDEIYHPERVQPLIDSRAQALRDMDDMQSHITSGFGNWIKKGIGHGLGFGGDFINVLTLGVAGAAGKVIGAGSDRLAAGLIERSLARRTAIAAARGAAEFATVSIPQGASQLALSESAFKDDFNSLDFIHQVGANALLGAITGGAVPLFFAGAKAIGFKLLNPQTARGAVDAADGQAMSGNRIDVTPILQHAHIEARTDGTEPTPEDFEHDIATYGRQIDTLTQQIEQKTGEIKQNWDKIPKTERSLPIAAIDIAKRIENNKLKAPEEITDLDKQIAAKPLPTTVKNVQSFYKQPFDHNFIGAEDGKFFNDVNEYKEAQHLTQNEPDLARGEELKRVEEQKAKFSSQNVDFPEFNKTYSVKRPNFLRSVLTQHDDIDDMLHKRAQLRQDVAVTDAQRNILSKEDLTPINAEQMVAIGRRNLSVEADGALLASDRTLEEEEKNLPDADTIEMPAEEQKVFDQLEPDENTQARLDELKEERGDLTNWGKIYNALANCLRG